MATQAREVGRLPTIGHWIGGALADGAGARSGVVYDPATGKTTKRVRYATAGDVDAAVAAAREAFPDWAATPVPVRARVMFRYRELIEAHRDELAALVTAEHGKVLSDAAGSVQRGLEVVEFACGIPQLLKGDYSAQVGTGIDSYALRQPLGVCAGITPFNFPAMVPMWMFPIAIACGNTFVLKPSERDPSCAMRLAELLHEAGLPPGVLNVVNGDREAVEALLAHDDVAAVSFVGSTAVAEQIYRNAAEAGKRVQALGGAKNHLVVMPDADMEQTADALIGSAFGSAGERCMAISAVVAVGAAAEPLLEALLPKVRALTVAPGNEPAAEMGPLITDEHRDKVRRYVDLGVEEGASLLVDGREHPLADGPGFFLGPCLFDHVLPGMRVHAEEIFGPVLVMLRAADFDDAVSIVNGHEYGNGTAIFTRDGDAAREYVSRIEVGMVGINVPIPVPLAFHSFGGWKRSLFGDMAVHGEEGVRFYTRLKTVTSRWPSGIRSGALFSMPTGE
ncbi:MAG: CoA-acylating methylmalonate-semialdehyde dehydrogenase [Gammaproteobacteria bacterium]